MFYLGFNNCATAEACLLFFFSFLFYFFLAKRHDIWKFTKLRPSNDYSDKINEFRPIDWIMKHESFFSIIVDNFENDPLYTVFLLNPAYEYVVIEKVQSSIDYDNSIVAFENFMEHEVTERWNSGYGVYVHPREAWYS